jgi:hypothetical protein
VQLSDNMNIKAVAESMLCESLFNHGVESRGRNFSSTYVLKYLIRTRPRGLYI